MTTIRHLMTHLRPDVVVHTRRATMSWAGSLFDAANRLRPLGELTTIRASRPAMELIALGSLRTLSVGADQYDEPLTGYIDRFDQLADEAARLRVLDERDQLDRTFFGFLSYDVAGDVRGRPVRPGGDVPNYHFTLPRVLIHKVGGSLQIAARGDTADSANRVLRRVVAQLGRHPSQAGGANLRQRPARLSADRGQFAESVRLARAAIGDGEVFTLNLGLDATVDGTGVNPFRIHDEQPYQAGPAPFEFAYENRRFGMAGHSPELFLQVAGAVSTVRPMTVTGDEDSTEWELAMHRMSVDLARNDLGRLCRPGSVRVAELMSLEHYGTTSYLTSEVRGLLHNDDQPADAVRACFPSGAVTGSPKARAMELIDDLEPAGRGLYGGAVGMVSADHASLHLITRSATLLNGRARFQAGVDVGYEADADVEFDRGMSRLRAVAAALDVTL